MSRAVPTFSSFPDLDLSEDSRIKDKKDRKSRKEKHKEREEKSSRRRHSRSRSRSQERSSKRRKHESRAEEKGLRVELLDDEALHSKRRERSVSRERGESTYSKAYYVDKRGDMGNLTYGTLDRRDVPKFHRAGRGKVLGLSSVWNITRGSGNKEVVIERRDRRKVPRYTDSKSRKLLVDGPRRLLTIPDNPDTTSYEFIALSKHKKLEDADVHDSYRSIERKKSYESGSDHSSHDSSSSSDSPQHTLTAEQHTIKTLEARVTSSPTDVESWLKLLDLSLKSLPLSTKRATQARAEISISLIRRAIDTHPENSLSLQLRLLYVEHGSELWTAKELQEEWERLLSSLGTPQSPPGKRAVVWLNWLEWRLNASKTVAGALNDTKRVFAMLHEERFEHVRVRLCWRVAVFLREAGFLEQGLAILQAQMELSWFCPEAISLQPLESQLNALEVFWEAEVPRIGEEDANGWAAWEAAGRPEAHDSGREWPSSTRDIEDPYKRWYSLEKALDTVGALSARSFNEDQQDPYGSIMFSDIRPFLSRIVSPRAKEYLYLAFFSFLGLNIPGIANIEVLGNSEEHLGFLHDEWMLSGLGGWVSTPDYLFPPRKQQQAITWESHAGITIGVERTRQPAFGPVKEWVYTRSFLEGVSASEEHLAWERTDLQDVLIDCVRQALTKYALKREEMLGAFEAALDVKSALKASRQRLEANRSSLSLWKTHARLERIRNKHAEASKIYTMAVALDPQSPDMPQLVADAVEFFWLRDDREAAQDILLRFLDIQRPFSGLNLLRARKNLNGRGIANGAYNLLWEACTRIRFFLELSATTIQDAMTAFETYLEELDVHSPPHESLTVWLCSTLWSISRMQGSMIPPAVASKRIDAALAEYGNNTILLGLFLECERGLGIWGRVRDLLDDSLSARSVTAKPKRLKRIAWEIWAEDWGYAPWEPERVRTKLENAVHIQSINHSVVLWRIYIVFEIRVNNLQRAKAVLFRALGNCPWAKGLYMMAFGPLREVFTVTELNDLVSAMAERGLRMRRDIEEFLDGWQDPAMIIDGMDDGNEGDVELEALVHGREQAKPYH
ncbi:hypothetical protein M408DRAFT_325432 [Serendipita vermifera MAFF 305830]|uniref:DUF1740-domain-containing protein n=1 Tax=Serendipita vermifera MAFF 305830 TaxID=933852 RepID=A0A0C3BP31_SERVB|nr:hypothetical protein M408DRAFT_325432 [Serendipita vermifera MAFF 305830]